jgi:hypothetical protein
MKPKQRILVRVLIAAAIIPILALIYLRLAAVPFVGVHPGEFSPVWQRTGYPRVEPDANIKCMIRRARLDFLVAPIEGLRGRIIFEEARVDGNDVYLLFGANSSDTVVVYRGSKKGCRLYAKLLLTLDA